MFAPITDREFSLFRDLIRENAGIHLSDAKKGLVSGRLARRLRQLNLPTFRDYFEVTRQDPRELQTTVDLLTTNETYFFREPKHFDYLRHDVLPRVRASEMKIWSAACSSGEEPYSLAMLLADVRGERGWNILATDISGKVIHEARQGIYAMNEGEEIPPDYMARFCLRGVRSQEGKFCIDHWLRDRIEFRQFNLNGSWSGVGSFHVIFLRNVMIYFSQQTKAQLVDRIADHLEPDGVLMVGHSETLNGLSGRFRMLKPSIYQLIG